MFEALTEKFTAVFGRLRGRTLSRRNVEEACAAVRQALLEADVHYSLARDFVTHVQEKAIGTPVLPGVEPADQFIKIVHDEMVALLGESDTEFFFVAKGPTVLMLAGLQGSGKTTTVAKCAVLLGKQGRKPLLVAADTQRPAAIDQLRILGEKISVPVFSAPELSPPEICRRAVAEARKLGADTVILDTAGRLALDEELMQELEEIVRTVHPHEILLVTDAMTGQDAVTSSEAFNDRLEISGVILTKLDGDARGGAALSIRAVTGKPIKLVGVGEKLEALEPFHPDRMAKRILGMGDVVSLVEKVQAAVDQEQALKLQEKLLKNEFTLDDMLQQFKMVRRAGPVGDLLGMIPGMGGLLAGQQVEEKDMDHLQAIISAMTPEERRRPELIDQSRRRRISRGSGTAGEEVSALLKQYHELRRLMSGKGRLAGLFGGMFGKKRGATPGVPGMPGLPGMPGTAGAPGGDGASRAAKKSKRKERKKERQRRRRGRR